MISVHEIEKSFGSLKAVDRISFEVADGELFGFLGPNGAGKTTTLNMLCGLLKPDGGTSIIDGVDVWQSPKRAKRNIGLVPQDLAIYEELTAIENLKFWGGLYHLPGSELKKNIQEVLERVGLSDRAKEPVKQFSGGMKRRLNLAIGLVHKPKFVLLDEPTVGIDPQARNAILDIIREIASEGATILFTTHHLEEAEALCQRIAIIDHGKILEMGTIDELAQVVGDGEVVSIRGEFSAAKIQETLNVEQIKILTAAENSVTLSLKENGFGIGQLVQTMTGAGLSIADMSIQKPSLESVFLKLTGRELRD
ncbi:MAG: ABC transporter ATP-binding protein [Candidatus Hinthialibacter antarcticus]|nr:ABC transporter ATP-binding protein [Candidatus Hinthialibacter antarcticus]